MFILLISICKKILFLISYVIKSCFRVRVVQTMNLLSFFINCFNKTATHIYPGTDYIITLSRRFPYSIIHVLCLREIRAVQNL